MELAFARMFSRHALTLALSDGVLVLSTGLCVPFAKALKSGKLKYNGSGVVIQHIYQTLMLAVAVNWTFNRQVMPATPSAG
jgi:sterol O-acyltransferase